MISGRYSIIQSCESGPGVGHKRNRRDQDFMNLHWINIDMDQLCVGSEAADLARYSIIEAQTNANNEISLVNRVVHMGCSEESRHPDIERMRRGKSTDAQQGRDHRNH